MLFVFFQILPPSHPLLRCHPLFCGFKQKFKLVPTYVPGQNWHVHQPPEETNEIQHQMVSKQKSVSFMDRVMWQIICYAHFARL